MSRLVQDLYLGKDNEQRRLITTPEGVQIRVIVADAGTRATAFIMDMLVVLLIVIGIAVLASYALGEIDGWRLAILQVVIFLLLNFYFVFFELRSGGRTPGKRWMRLRVIDAEGGHLSPQSVFARNLVRDVEVFLPMSILMAPQQTTESSSGLVRAACILWVLGLMFWPLFNKDRKRIGDLIGGTLVVLSPRTQLARDVADTTAAPAHTSPRRPGQPPAAATPRYAFSDKQLDVYGEYELKVLENVLRGGEAVEHAQAVVSVYEKIRRKIRYGGTGVGEDPEAFLRDFYAALRARLERQRLFGKVKKDKFSRD